MGLFLIIGDISPFCKATNTVLVMSTLVFSAFICFQQVKQVHYSIQCTGGLLLMIGEEDFYLNIAADFL